VTPHCEIIHHLGREVVAERDGVTLFRYDYGGDLPADEAPKPYMHPVRTLAGDAVTGFRPTDHPWHHGLSMTVAHLNGQNFWGGNTYVRGEGYKLLDNNGVQQHGAWERLERASGLPVLEHTLDWTTRAGERWIAERRCWRVAAIDPSDGHWRLDARFTLENVSAQTLEFGSPTTEGRPNAGYGSLFWRGPRDFTGGTVLADGGLEGEEAIRGTSAPWLAFTGRHDGSLNRSTLVFVDHPDNPRYPNKWFVRSDPTPVASYSFIFDEAYSLAPGETLDLRYAMIVANGAREREAIASLAARAFA